MIKSLPVHMFWQSEDLSRLARLSLASFRRHGFRVTLWSYEPDAHAMSGAGVRDARELVQDGLDADMPLPYLSSLLRYRALADIGGMWADMDMVALSDSPDIQAAPLIASEYRRSADGRCENGQTRLSTCLMVNPEPEPGDLWSRAAAAAAALGPQAWGWENAGPDLMARLLQETPGQASALGPEVTDPPGSWNVPSCFLGSNDPPNAPFMHMHASLWAEHGLDAEGAFAEGSLAGRLWREFGL
jgi:hypothetical protein